MPGSKSSGARRGGAGWAWAASGLGLVAGRHAYGHGKLDVNLMAALDKMAGPAMVRSFRPWLRCIMRNSLLSLIAISLLAALAGCAAQPVIPPRQAQQIQPPQAIDPSAAVTAGFKINTVNHSSQADQSQTQSQTPPADSQNNADQANTDQTPSSDNADNGQTAINDFPNIPDGAVYSIYCMTIDTPTHVMDADRLKEQLIRKTGLHDWYVVHSQDNSKLYYGFYKTFDDSSQPAEVARAQHDLHFIQQLKDNAGDFPFVDCVFQPLDTPDPAAPAAWDLRNAKGYWSLQIAAYVGSPYRKQYAVDAVRRARALGIQAYFYHGAGASSVCVGVWPRDAIKEQDAANASTDVPYKHVMVLPQPLPEGTRTDNVYAPDGEKVKVMVPRIQVLDPTLTEMMEQYPHNAVNGMVRYHNIPTAHGTVRVADPSFLVIIPHGNQQTASGGGNDNADAGGGNSGAAQQDDGQTDQQNPAPANGIDGIEGN